MADTLPGRVYADLVRNELILLFSYCLIFVRQRRIEQKYYTKGKAMEFHSRKCQRCEEFGPNTTKLPLHYTRRARGDTRRAL
jgi:hypothetical protein